MLETFIKIRRENSNFPQSIKKYGALHITVHCLILFRAICLA